jgi:hypothetical protein
MNSNRSGRAATDGNAKLDRDEFVEFARSLFNNGPVRCQRPFNWQFYACCYVATPSRARVATLRLSSFLAVAFSGGLKWEYRRSNTARCEWCRTCSSRELGAMPRTILQPSPLQRGACSMARALLASRPSLRSRSRLQPRPLEPSSGRSELFCRLACNLGCQFTATPLKRAFHTHVIRLRCLDACVCVEETSFAALKDCKQTVGWKTQQSLNTLHGWHRSTQSINRTSKVFSC